MRKRIALCVALAAAAIAYSCGGSDPSSPPPPTGPTSATLFAVQDGTLYEDSLGQWANGAGQYLHAGVTALGGSSGEPPEIRRALIAFDVAAGVPPGATVDSVFLRIRVQNAAPASGTRLHKLYRVTTEWGEGATVAGGFEGGGAPAELGDVTWIHTFYDTVMWTTPGGDFVPSASDSITIDGVNYYTFGSTSQMVADVQGWLDNPSTDFGWIIRGDESTHTTARRIASRTNMLNTDFRPKLTVFFTK